MLHIEEGPTPSRPSASPTPPVSAAPSPTASHGEAGDHGASVFHHPSVTGRGGSPGVYNPGPSPAPASGSPTVSKPQRPVDVPPSQYPSSMKPAPAKKGNGIPVRSESTKPNGGGGEKRLRGRRNRVHGRRIESNSSREAHADLKEAQRARARRNGA